MLQLFRFILPTVLLVRYDYVSALQYEKVCYSTTSHMHKRYVGHIKPFIIYQPKHSRSQKHRFSRR